MRTFKNSGAYVPVPNKDYFGITRKEIVSLLPERVDRVFEIGCGEGNTLSWLKAIKGCQWIGGIELCPASAGIAKAKLDVVYQGDIEKSNLPLEDGSIDLILCLDVLEHLVDPWTTLSRVHKLLKPGGYVISSIPNVRHYSALAPLLIKGVWEYQASGILDKTHLRFFTRHSAVGLMQSSGLLVDIVESTGLERGRKVRYLNAASMHIFKSFFEYQYLIRAKNVSAP